MNGTNEVLARRRREAIEHFARLGLPNRKTEAWKYTPIEKRVPDDARVYMESTPPALALETIDAHVIPGLEAWTVVTVNGRFSPERSRLEGWPEAVLLGDLHHASERHPGLFNTYFGRGADATAEVFVALNTAFARDGLFLYVPAGTKLEKPVHVLHYFDAPAGLIVQPRLVYVADTGSELTVIEHFVDGTSNAVFVNAVTEWTVAERARVDHYQVQEFGPASTVVHTVCAHQAGNSLFDTHTTTLRAGFLRNNLTIVPDGEGCESHLFGLVMGADSMHVDNHTLVDHRTPNCLSNELYKNILDDESTAVFNGKVFVRPGAQKINAYQSNKSVTLTRKARVYSKPELEIYADDVKCSHGATTGQLDADALFYLRSRGIHQEQARSMLLMAFARDVIEEVKVPDLRDYLDRRIADIL